MSKEFRTISLDTVLRGTLPKAIIQMLKDRFLDFEEVIVKAPVREHTIEAIAQICELAKDLGGELNRDVSLLI